MKSFLIVLILSIAILIVAFLAMGIKILVLKNGKFPRSSVGKNPALAKQGIRCAKHEEIARFKKMQRGRIRKINPKQLRVMQNG